MSLDRLLRYWAFQFFSPETVLKEKYKSFKKILQADRQAHLHMARLEEIFYHRKQVDCSRIDSIYHDLSDAVAEMVSGLQELAPGKFSNLKDYFKKIDFYCRLLLAPMIFDTSRPYVFLSGMAGGDENLLGGKGQNLNLLKNKLGLPVPDFFIVTTHAFFYFLESNKATSDIETILSQVNIQKQESLESSSSNILKLLQKARLPEDLGDSILKAVELVFQGRANLLLSVRSSAVAEDRESSFAGQYLTLLKVEPGDILSAYQRVIKSKYNPSPLYYRIKKGYCDMETPMAVIVQEMIETKAAGVAYSRNPDKRLENFMTIYAVPGPGELVVDGTETPEIINLDRKTGEPVTNLYYQSGDAGNHKNILPESHVHMLGEWLSRLEEYFSHPVDIEWCLTSSGRLKILQARALTAPDIHEAGKPDLDFKGLEVIYQGGIAASPGCGSGPVFRVSRHDDLTLVPPGAVIVAEHATPDFVEVFEQISALVTEKGSAASHCASVARELGVPYLCDVAGAMDNLEKDMDITVDATNSRIFRGIARQCKKRTKRRPAQDLPATPLFNKLAQLVKMVSKLSLLDAESRHFRPESCRSIHDIIRFVHECAMREMFFIGSKGMHPRRGARKLVGEFPMTFYVLDVGGGLRNDVKGDEISIEAVRSRPMKAFWKGLTDPSVRWSDTEHFAWEEFDSIVLAGGIADKDAASLSSYAVLAHDYMNLSIRFGYHFVQIDALATEDLHSNYITFRFSGGGGRPEGKLLRASFISGVLRHLGFKTESTGELVDARIKPASQKDILRVLVDIGRLVGATRLMDMYLDEDSDISRLIQDFLQGRSDFSRNYDGESSDEK